MALPNSDQMMSWIRQIVSQGIRRPGYAADQWIERWSAGLFESFGLTKVRLEPVELARWEPLLAEVRVLPDGPTINGLQLPYTAKGNIEADLVPIDEGDDLEGRIAVSEHSLNRFRQSVARSLATASYDPNGDFEWLEQTLPIGTNPGELIEAAIAKKASALVGLLTGFPWETVDYYVPY
ncbi:MAG: M28 family metallopeptidase, partial [Acidimicrobiia bacterium]